MKQDQAVDRERLEKQIAFIVEIDRLKRIFRQTYLTDASRKENDAEHSWHLAVMALILLEHAGGPAPDILRTVSMVLIHDIVEIDAGDTFCYDDAGAKDREARERRAADRLFAILPPDQAAEFRALWEEFEARRTPEARFAAALDRLQPLLHNYITGGKSWQEHGVTADRVVERNRHIAEGSEALWGYAASLIGDAVKKGYLEGG